MKINKLKSLRLSFYIFVGVLILGCKKEGDPSSLIEYVSKNMSAYKYIPTNSGDNVIINMNIIDLGAQEAGFRVLLKEKYTRDVFVSARIDNNRDLIDAYDMLYNYKSPVFESDLFEIVEPELMIKAGEVQSSDSVKVRLKDVSSLPVGQMVFVIPIKLESKDSGVQLKSELMFIRFNVSAINLTASLSGIKGESDMQIFVSNGDSEVLPLQVKLSQAINRPADVLVDDEGRDELVAAYNLQHNTNYLPFPAESYKLYNTATVKANETVSATGIRVEIVNSALFKSPNLYMVPIKVNSSDPKNVLADPEKDRVNIFLFVSNILKGAVHELVGDVVDRSIWKIKAAYSASATFSIEKILDGKNSTYWLGDTKKDLGVFEIDMGGTETIKGFKITPSYGPFQTSNVLEMDIFSSEDGVNWKQEGRYFGSPTSPTTNVNNPDVKVVKFTNAVTARYFKCKVLKTTFSAGLTSIAEFNAIK
ncbi:MULTISPECIES: BT_3987 domain-containing protein [Sphingobacterium]|uniref:BT_3987 domain-containing protein n=1 Tax=Sphingobacterium TaxID=28453 RepID=UPI0013DC0458|nr:MULTISPECIES: DUF1735 domain-containing protein [unclassified Sphingobacterium]